MLIVLTLALVIISLMMITVRKSSELLLLFGMCITLALEICGVMIFMAKKGGIAEDVILFLYFSKGIKSKLAYLGITLNSLGFMIALGRILFPMFMLKMAVRYSMIPWIRKRQWIKHIIIILPLSSLVVYYPTIYRYLTGIRPELGNIIMDYQLVWLTTYIVIAAVLLLWEYYSITMKFCKRQFGYVVMSMFAMCCLYMLYYRQDPGQVYQFYSDHFVWNRGIGYLQFNPDLPSYIGLVFTTVGCMVTGFFSLFQYTSEAYVEQKEDMVMQRKFDMAKIGVSMFVHGVKNQLLASKVVYKRIWQEMEQDNPDMIQLKSHLTALESLNESMVERVEELYRSIKSNAITLSPIDLEEIIYDSIERFRKKYPDDVIEIDCKEKIFVLADRPQLCEALYNLLINAQDAVLMADRKEEGSVSIHCYNERLYTVIEVVDSGNGMTKKHIRKAFEPFYTSKNSNYNWGMGLYYVREVVRGHLGFVKVESKVGQGSHFYIMLPRYQ